MFTITIEFERPVMSHLTLSFSSPHPYIFFNHDRHSMTFLGFRLSPNGDLLDPSTNAILEQKLMNPTLRGQLNTQGVNFDVNYEKRNRFVNV